MKLISALFSNTNMNYNVFKEVKNSFDEVQPLLYFHLSQKHHGRDLTYGHAHFNY